MKRKAIWLVLSLLILMGLLASGFGCAAPKPTPAPAPKPAPAPTPTTPAQPFYKGKIITMVVPYSPGGGTDIVSRLWARQLPRFIPGNPTVIVNNIPGAGALIGSNYAYNAKPDGTTVLVGCGGSYMGSLFKLPEAKYDYRKMTMVMADMCGLVFFAKTGMVDTPYDITKPQKKWIPGFTPTGFYLWFYAVGNEIMEIPTEKVLAVYTSAAGSRMALFSGEVNMSTESSMAYKQVITPYVQRGEIIPLFSTGVLDAEGKIVRDPLVPNIPTFVEIAERVTGKPASSGKALEAMKAIMGGGNYMHHLLVPPGVPDVAIKTLWEASTQMMKDPAYQKDAEPLGCAPPFIRTGEAVNKVFHSEFGMSDETTTWIMNLVWERYHIRPVG